MRLVFAALLSLLASMFVPMFSSAAWDPREPSTGCMGDPLQVTLGTLTPERKRLAVAEEEARLADLQKKAEQGDQNAAMALCMYHVTFVPPDYPRAVTWCRKAVDQGNLAAANQLGIYYRDGLGVPQDYTEAVKFWRKAATQSAPYFGAASCELAWMYADGKGAKQDWSEAYYWGTLYSLVMGYHERSHPLDTARHLTPEQIQIVNQLVLARATSDPILMEPLRKQEAHENEVAELKTKAEHGDAAAQTDIGWLYHEGAGLPKDDAEAMRWFRKAADQSYARAQDSIGEMYGAGWGVPRDAKEAISWHRKAADQGYVGGLLALGTTYDSGVDGKPDYEEAYYWLSLAARAKADSSFPFPKGMLEMAAKQLTADQKTAVSKRVEEWKPNTDASTTP